MHNSKIKDLESIYDYNKITTVKLLQLVNRYSIDNSTKLDFILKESGINKQACTNKIHSLVELNFVKLIKNSSEPKDFSCFILKITKEGFGALKCFEYLHK